MDGYLDTVLFMSQDMVNVPVWLQNISNVNALKFALMLTPDAEFNRIPYEVENKLIDTTQFRLISCSMVSSEEDSKQLNAMCLQQISCMQAHYQLKSENELTSPEAIMAYQQSTLILSMIFVKDSLKEQIDLNGLLIEMQESIRILARQIVKCPLASRSVFHQQIEHLQDFLKSTDKKLNCVDTFENKVFRVYKQKMFKPVFAFKKSEKQATFDGFVLTGKSELQNGSSIQTTLSPSPSQIFTTKLAKHSFFTATLPQIFSSNQSINLFTQYIFKDFPSVLRSGFIQVNDQIRPWCKKTPYSQQKSFNELHSMMNYKMYQNIVEAIKNPNNRVILFGSSLVSRVIINSLFLSCRFDYTVDYESETFCENITNGDLIINLLLPLNDVQKQLIAPFQHLLIQNEDVRREQYEESMRKKCQCGRYKHHIMPSTVKFQYICSDFYEYHISELVDEIRTTVCINLSSCEIFEVPNAKIEQNYYSIMQESPKIWRNTKIIKPKPVKWDTDFNVNKSFMSRLSNIQ